MHRDQYLDPNHGAVAFPRIGVVLVRHRSAGRRIDLGTGLRDEAAQISAAWAYPYLCAVLGKPQADWRSQSRFAIRHKTGCHEDCRQQPMHQRPPNKKSRRWFPTRVVRGDYSTGLISSMACHRVLPQDMERVNRRRKGDAAAQSAQPFGDLERLEN
jgi:hypothetical protein